MLSRATATSRAIERFVWVESFVPRVLIHPTKEPTPIEKEAEPLEEGHGESLRTMRPVPLEEELLRRVLLAENFFEKDNPCFHGSLCDMIPTVPEHLDFAAEEDPIESCYLALVEGFFGERSTD
jgi:hypothetical protein